jgi:hypothetical protein
MSMRISWTTAAATVFTTYMTLSNISHVVGNKMAASVRGWFIDPEYGELSNLISYELAFWFVGITSIAPLFLLFFVKPKEVDKARLLESV